MRPASNAIQRPALTALSDRDPATFHIYGVLTARDRFSRPHFNFPQRCWLYPGVGMNWSARAPRAVTTLAVNILMHFIDDKVDKHLLKVAEAFALDFLLTMPAAGGRIPREVITEWLAG